MMMPLLKWLRVRSIMGYILIRIGREWRFSRSDIDMIISFGVHW